MECSISKETLRNKFVTLKRKLYYIDRSVLLENTPLIKFRDPSGVFSISSPVRILMTSFPTFVYCFLCKQSVKNGERYVREVF